MSSNFLDRIDAITSSYMLVADQIAEPVEQSFIDRKLRRLTPMTSWVVRSMFDDDLDEAIAYAKHYAATYSKLPSYILELANYE